MTIFQISILGLYAALVLVFAVIATVLYYLIFVTVMIAWDGCEMCQRLKQGLMVKAAQGH